MSARTGLCACGKPGCSDGSDQVAPVREGAHMSGPQHYAEAERLLASVAGADVWSPTGGAARVHAATLAEAQVHATLALVAATADQTAARGPGDVDPSWNPILRGSAGVGEAE